MSFVVESPLTGLGAGGFALVHSPGGETAVLDFFVEAAGRGSGPKSGALEPVEIVFEDTPQVFNIGPASCAVPGTPAGLWELLKRYGTMSFRDAAQPAIAAARSGSIVTAAHAYIFELLKPAFCRTEECRELYRPENRWLRTGDRFFFPALGDALELLAAEGPDPFYVGATARALSQWVLDRGGLLSMDDLAGYRPVVRTPVEADYRGRTVLTNPPPSAGGILIAFALDLLDRSPDKSLRRLVEVMRESNLARAGGFSERLRRGEVEHELLGARALDAAAARVARRSTGPLVWRGSDTDAGSIGSTTHIAVMDKAGNAASITCSNGCGSSVIVPGTGIHLNNMMGEADLNPDGFFKHEPGTRMTSMMAPTVVLRDGVCELALGSAGSNRIRSAILQTIVALVRDRLSVERAVARARIHFEDDTVQAEPGVDAAALDELEALDYPVSRWRSPNPYFGGVQAVAFDPETGTFSGAGDPRRDGAARIA